MQKLKSLSICFPCYNDAGTIGTLVATASAVVSRLTEDYEIIVVNDGSSDTSAQVLEELQKRYRDLKVVHHAVNQGYGATLRDAFQHATKEWIFYTDGDGQYDVWELTKLVAQVHEGVDIVNGYKIARQDPFYRIFIGHAYNWINKLLFGLRIRDIDCDFRLFRRAILDKITLTSTGGEICVELIQQCEALGLSFAEVSVSHYHRVVGRSQFFHLANIVHCLRGLLQLWWNLVWCPKTKNIKNWITEIARS